LCLWERGRGTHIALDRVDPNFAWMYKSPQYAAHFWRRSSASALASGRRKIDVTTRDQANRPETEPFRDNSLTRFTWTTASRKAVLEFRFTRVDVYSIVAKRNARERSHSQARELGRFPAEKASVGRPVNGAQVSPIAGNGAGGHALAAIEPLEAGGDTNPREARLQCRNASPRRPHG